MMLGYKHCSTHPQQRKILEVLQAQYRRAKQRIEGRQWRDRLGPVRTASNGLLKGRYRLRGEG
ncbi:hypothetical protein PMIT1342_01554 [Prochlorococcus marinus str. MIT 1342]|uniref:hypothetical protein n=1 Tax=Prochlorococcus TaxID=1218 RepID=UPI0007BC52A1|nr:hypothetical protein [Prochlorococcus marinus]KZR81219.1 hypothetical protein PMIT1342_01554 [Prochlorococcus marinus str. MIT 1342]